MKFCKAPPHTFFAADRPVFMKASKKAFQHIAVTASVAAANQDAGNDGVELDMA